MALRATTRLLRKIERQHLARLALALALAFQPWPASAQNPDGARPSEPRPQAPERNPQLEQALHDYESGRMPDAQRRFERLAARGVAVARFNLAVMHLRGEAVPTNRQRARHLLEQAAAQGFVTAMYALGQGWDDGSFGTIRRDEAARWYERSAIAGSVDGQIAAGTAYYLGRGVPQDRTAAARWYRAAAQGGDVGAQYLVASMYEHGDGLPTDLRLARYWYAAAARNGDVAAPGKIEEIDARSAPAEPGQRAASTAPS